MISQDYTRLKHHPAPWRAGAIAVGLAVGFPAGAFAAEPVAVRDSGAVLSGPQIEQALHPALTRSFVPRGLTRRDAGDATQSVNLNIPFEHHSSALMPQASAQLRQLQLALDSAALAKDRFIVAGHTDAKGSLRYNKLLSLRRAQAVKQFLVSNGIKAARLETMGYGSEHPLKPNRPGDPSNRRVEIRDLGSSEP